MQYNRLGSTDMIVSKLGFEQPLYKMSRYCIEWLPSDDKVMFGIPKENERFENYGIFPPLDPKIAKDLVATALECGVNYFDTAPWYGFIGRAEAVLGKALESVPRTSYYMATKIGRYDSQPEKMFDFSAEKTLASVDESLNRLGCEFFDVIQVHDIEFAPSLDVILNETLPALQKIKESGKARYIGITGYPLQILQALVNRSSGVTIDTVLSYCRCCLHDTELLNYVTQFKEKGLGVIDAAGLGMGLYVPSLVVPKWHPASQDIKDACQKAADYCKEQNVQLSKLAVHFNLSQDGPDTHLISCTDVKALQDNIDVCIHGLNSHEENVLKDIQNKFFIPLTTKNWEGLELQKYLSKLPTYS